MKRFKSYTLDNFQGTYANWCRKAKNANILHWFFLACLRFMKCIIMHAQAYMVYYKCIQGNRVVNHSRREHSYLFSDSVLWLVKGNVQSLQLWSKARTSDSIWDTWSKQRSAHIWYETKRNDTTLSIQKILSEESEDSVWLSGRHSSTLVHYHWKPQNQFSGRFPNYKQKK